MKEVLVRAISVRSRKGIGYQVRKRRGDIKSFGKVRPMIATLNALGSAGYADYDPDEETWVPSGEGFQAMQLGEAQALICQLRPMFSANWLEREQDFTVMPDGLGYFPMARQYKTLYRVSKLD